jgi:glucose/mannose-6-phosphate isomerase
VKRARRSVDWTSLAARHDAGGMGDRIEASPGMFCAGAALAAPALARIEPLRPRRLVLLGMGGSAIAGDLLRVWADREGSAPVHVVRHYEPPAWLTPEDFLVFSSYSGGTEETLEAFRGSRLLGARSCALTTGGALGARAAAAGLPVVRLPDGHPPRAALGYSFSALAALAGHLGVIERASERVAAAAGHLDRVASTLGRNVLESGNPAKRLAIRLENRALILLAGTRTLEPVALRWKGQLNENAKHLAWVSPLPETNHNEIDGFVHPGGTAGRLGAVLLVDAEEHPRVAKRFRWLRSHLRGLGVEVTPVVVEGPDPLARALGAVLLGDFLSYYLALLHRTDPGALPGVGRLKRYLAT